MPSQLREWSTVHFNMPTCMHIITIPPHCDKNNHHKLFKPARYPAGMVDPLYRRLVCLFFMILVMASSAVAIEFSADILPLGQTIKLNETARFNLTINNPSTEVEQFEIYSPDVQWDVSTDPTSDRIVRIRPKGNVSTTLVVRPLYVNPGLYIVGLVIKRSGSSELVRKNLEVGIVREIVGEYTPSIRSQLDFTNDLDPRKNATLKLDIENQNRRDIGNITIKIRSNLINDDLYTKLNPLETKHLILSYALDPKLSPQQDTIRVSIFTQWRNRTVQFDIFPHPYEIIPYGGIDERAEQENFILARRRSVRFTNTGNNPRTKVYKERLGPLQEKLLSATPDPQVKKTPEGAIYTWKIELTPGEEATITITENYRPFAYLTLLIIVIILGYYFARTPVLIRKAAMVVETKEGGISELKVLITLKNRSGSQLMNVHIVDRIPSIAELKPDHEVGTLRPTQVLKHEAQGTQLRWSLETIDPHEERLLSYKIRTKLSVLGGLNLPPCRLTFKQYGYGRSTVSNVENLFGGH